MKTRRNRDCQKGKHRWSDEKQIKRKLLHNAAPLTVQVCCRTGCNATKQNVGVVKYSMTWLDSFWRKVKGN